MDHSAVKNPVFPFLVSPPQVPHSHHTLQVVPSGSHVERRVPVSVDGPQVTVGLQQSLGDVLAARQSRPVQAHVLLLRGEWSEVTFVTICVPFQDGSMCYTII